MLTIISRGVEISIAGGVEEMVRATNPLCFFFLFFFFYHAFCFIKWVQKLRGA